MRPRPFEEFIADNVAIMATSELRKVADYYGGWDAFVELVLSYLVCAYRSEWKPGVACYTLLDKVKLTALKLLAELTHDARIA